MARTLLEIFTREAAAIRRDYVRARDAYDAKRAGKAIEPPAADPSGVELIKRIDAHCGALAAAGDRDALRVIEHIAARAVMGGKQYGPLKLATDKRDWRKEAGEEAVDGLFYMACRALLAPPPRVK